MKNEDIYNGITNIKDSIINEADTYSFTNEKRKLHHRWIGIATIAAGLSLVVGLAFMVDFNGDGKTNSSGTVIEQEKVPNGGIGIDSIIHGSEIPNVLPSEGTTLKFESYEDLYEAMHEKTVIYYPAYKGEKVQIKSHKGNRVLWRPSEKFGLPWILYYCDIEGHDIVFEICHLDSVGDSSIGDKASYSEISAVLAPSYPLANTFSEEHKKAYKSIIEKEITLAAVKTSATIFDYNEENYWHRINYRFRYKDLLISVWNIGADDYDFVNEEFLAGLSFEIFKR